MTEQIDHDPAAPLDTGTMDLLDALRCVVGTWQAAHKATLGEACLAATVLLSELRIQRDEQPAETWEPQP